MSDFFTVLDEYLGDSDSIGEIRVVARRLWYYDFESAPLLLWDGQGLLTTSDDLEWYGSMNDSGNNLHTAPNLKDGRDGTSARYEFTLKIPDIPGQTAFELYEEIKASNETVKGRKIVCSTVLFHVSEGLRPQTPRLFLKELVMQSAVFNERLTVENGAMRRECSVTIIARDDNTGRSNKPRRTYADTLQKEHARQNGVVLDKGCEYLAELANRTYVIP